MAKYLFFLLSLCLVSVLPGQAQHAAKRQLVVAQNGSGDFRTIQAAINSLPTGAALPLVFIKNGTYHERVTIEGRPGLVVRGQSEQGVIITISEANATFRCSPANANRWDVATLNLRNSPSVTLEKLTVINSYGADHPNGETITCANEPGGKKVINSADHQMAFYTAQNTSRLVVRHCTFRTLGNDTVSPWDKEDGLYYFADCTMEGSVDFYCPRGWAYAENCRFICHNLSAAIWHDGSMNQDAKFVLKNCTFTGDDGFKLGRYHHDSQFYLVNCRFARNMADADIYPAPSGDSAPLWGRRVYYANCHREGGDYAWLHDNLVTAPHAPTPQQITANWTFGGRWNVDPKAPKLPPPGPVAQDTIAERMLVYQRLDGGWPKAIGEQKVDYYRPLSPVLKAMLLDEGGRNDATIDNDATTREISYLLHAFQKTSNDTYRQAAERGVAYLLKMQYPNGGFPQFYPDLSGYHHEITYNDDAMIRVLTLLRHVAERRGDYASVQSLRNQAQAAVARGIDCILKTQYVRNGQLTAWCAQYDEKTLQPAKARMFELPSLSGSESVGIVRFLMDIDQPSAAVKASIEGAISWFEKVKMPGYALKDIVAPQEPRGRDRVIVPAPGAVLWARFYELETDRPIYVGRDSRVHYNLTEVENERRTGYGYAGTWPTQLLREDYPKWQQKQAKATSN
jgi:PelA/Pel-15E family pectate lyase